MKSNRQVLLKTTIAIVMIFLVFLSILSIGLWIIKQQGTVPKEEKVINEERILEQKEVKRREREEKKRGYKIKKEDILKTYTIENFLSNDTKLYQISTEYTEKQQDISAYDAAAGVMEKAVIMFPDFEWEKEIYIYYKKNEKEKFYWQIYIINSKTGGNLIKAEAKVDAVTGEIFELYAYDMENRNQSNSEKWLSQKEFLHFTDKYQMGALGRGLIKKFDLAEGKNIIDISEQYFNYDPTRSMTLLFTLGNTEFADTVVLMIDMNTEELIGYEIRKYSDEL